MCGICGFVSADPSVRMPLAVARAMRDSMVHRGPDDAGEYLAPGVFLGSRRLAILDLSARGHMPMSDGSGRYHAVYNGEVYNFAHLRRGLEARGYRFRSNTDTEVVLHLYADRGPAMLDELNGMFALAVWDSAERTLFLARDRLGVKPLYYSRQGGDLYFASEPKALLAAGIPGEFDSACWEELLTFRFTAGENTVLKGIHRLLPGHTLRWDAGNVAVRRWWRLDEKAIAARDAAPADAAGWFRETFDEAVALRRISDVPVGVLLSGGLDSSTVAAALAQAGGRGAASFTVRFEEPRYDEGPLARQVAERWELQHHELSLPAQGMAAELREASWLNDEPLVHGNDAHIFAISRYAKPRVTVLLSGEGADETLGGYVRYAPLRYPAALGLLRPVLPGLARALQLNGRVGKLGRLLAAGPLETSVLYNAADVLPEDLAALGVQPRGAFEYRSRVLAEASRLYPGEPVRQAMYLDQHTYLCSILDRNDRMTMGASIECRVPFLDYRLVEGAAALPSRLLFHGRRGKAILRQALGSRLPEGIRRHRKWGFAAPWSRYLRSVPELREIVAQLPFRQPVCSGPMDRRRLQDTIAAFLSGDDRLGVLIRQLLMLAVWHESYFARAAQAPKLALEAGR
ncbi:MAG: asparagine synthase (glutamine-hydrolyzing) [Bryobacterales bacterium]|nr:asparagine synthase (glutamine-hydrolyzing) [Bryobacterales bacterium]